MREVGDHDPVSVDIHDPCRSYFEACRVPCIYQLWVQPAESPCEDEKGTISLPFQSQRENLRKTKLLTNKKVSADIMMTIGAKLNSFRFIVVV